ncbi:aryl-sulfate sulfotransferase [Halomicroarcula sp. GCM10025324]|uniref:aryl-sulfate sulfotransferase n=1 Tax=Haloarcula TaxID=2237 RepID=UPI0023E89210|nr:aryl-sulfate sulfotransferase [Halomicroarcula sp. ZS-22-S1]
MLSSIRSRRWLVRGVVALLVLSLLTPMLVSAATHDPSDAQTLQRGTLTSPANGTTVVSAQGYTFQGNTNRKKPARLVAVDERGRLEWTHQNPEGTNGWFFDVDPLPNGNLLVVSPREGNTLIYEFDPETQERVWKRLLPYEDTHDADMLNDTALVISHMRAWEESNQTSMDEIVVYNLTTDEVTWSWQYRNHFPPSTDGGMNDDWTHSNDVDPVGDDQFLVSPRNFDQVLLINRTTKDIDMRLGADGNHSTLDEQHNPDFLRGEDATPTMLVADSHNNRVVEYAYTNGTWTRTWSVGSNTLNWPRDADRLPNGNTLITDTLNHRVIEVTPTGEIVWEYYATWGPYDSERVAHGDGSKGPTIREQNATGTYDITGSANLTAGGEQSVPVGTYIRATFAGTPLSGVATEVGTVWGHYAPWLRPVWMTGWALFYGLLAGLLALGWLLTEVGLVGYRRFKARSSESPDTAQR